MPPVEFSLYFVLKIAPNNYELGSFQVDCRSRFIMCASLSPGVELEFRGVGRRFWDVGAGTGLPLLGGP